MIVKSSRRLVESSTAYSPWRPPRRCSRPWGRLLTPPRCRPSSSRTGLGLDNTLSEGTVALILRITTRIWLGWDLLHCSPALSPPPLRHFGGIKEDILKRIMQGFMIPCCRRTRHWTLQTLPGPVLPHNSLAGTLIVTIFHQVPLNPGHSWRWYKLFCTLGN